MDMVKEHKVDTRFAGKPRWWTVCIKGKTWECVRVDYTHVDERLLMYVFLPPGAFTWPPLVAAIFQAGDQAFDRVRELGGKHIGYETDAGKKLERILMAGRQT